MLGLRTLTVALGAAFALAGCSDDSTSAEGESTGGTDSSPTSGPSTTDDASGSSGSSGSDTSGGLQPLDPNMKPSYRKQLVWKRYTALERDLMNALELEQNQICNELGQFNCVEVHKVPLGGNNAVSRSMYERPPESLSTTPIAIDRIVLAACSERVNLDAASEEPVVFTEYDLEWPALDPSNEQSKEKIDAQLTDLYRRILSRDPRVEELEVLYQLTVDDAGHPIAAIEFSKLACFAIATTTEVVFF